MIAICDEGMCAGCMACVDCCPTGAVSVGRDLDAYWPVINQGKCVDCGRCVKTCQQLNPAKFREPISWFQGWASDAEERSSSSSGGFASSVARAFVASGGVVCSCAFSKGRFGFDFIENQTTVSRSKGSKYVKSDPAGVYRQAKLILENGRKLCFIGLPCQVSAMRNYVGRKLEEDLYTVDLICHGTPSSRLLEMFLAEKGLSLDELNSISFRKKTKFQITCDGRSVDLDGVTDRYLMAFLHGLSYTENCYSCLYARKERVSDLTLGDSWGSELKTEEKRGISLAICQTPKGEELLYGADLELRDVDLDRAVANNAQLEAPSNRPPQRSRFVNELRNGATFERAVARSFPKQCFKQDVKRVLVRLGFLK